MIVTEENQENGWSDVQAEEVKQDGEYLKSLLVNPQNQEEKLLIEKLKNKSKIINEQNEEFEILNNEDENIEVRRPSQNDMQDYGMIQQKKSSVKN